MVWSIDEENELLRIVNLQKGYPDWEEISKLLKEVNIVKSAQQCFRKCYNKNSEEYKNLSIPKRGSNWSNSEEKELLRILSLQKEYPDWEEISNLLKEVNIDRSAK